MIPTMVRWCNAAMMFQLQLQQQLQQRYYIFGLLTPQTPRLCKSASLSIAQQSQCNTATWLNRKQCRARLKHDSWLKQAASSTQALGVVCQAMAYESSVTSHEWMAWWMSKTMTPWTRSCGGNLHVTWRDVTVTKRDEAWRDVPRAFQFHHGRMIRIRIIQMIMRCVRCQSVMFASIRSYITFLNLNQWVYIYIRLNRSQCAILMMDDSWTVRLWDRLSDCWL